MKLSTCILIDDYPLAISSLRAEIEDHCPELSIVGTADGVVSGLKLLKEEQVDLVFLDIDLKDGNGFDILDLIGEKQIAVIFTTGSKEHAIKAFQYAAVDYLLKPVDPELLKLAVAKAQKQINQNAQISILKEASTDSKKLTRLAVHTQEKIQIIDIDNIIRIEADSNYCFIHQLDQPKILVSKTLKEYEKILDSNAFIRVHQSHLIQIGRIKAFIKTDGGYVLMQDGTKVPVSVRKKAHLLEILKKMGDDFHPPAER
jgi:two-component system LytT family response regulator